MRDFLEDVADGMMPVTAIIAQAMVVIAMIVIIGLLVFVAKMPKEDETVSYDHAIINMNGIERTVEISEWSQRSGTYALTTINGDHFKVSGDNVILTDARE